MNKIKIYINHINFLVRLPNYDYKYKNIIEILTNRLSTYSFKYDYHKKRNVRVKDRVFAAINNSKLEYRFNINMLKDFIVTLGQQGIGKEDIEVHRKDECKSEELGLESIKDYSLRDYQVTYENILLEKKLPYMLVDLATGHGKATSLDTKIRISDGWKLMRDIKVGDKVIGRDGKETNVLGVYPQGVVDMYRITFFDGRSSKVSGDHLWSVIKGRGIGINRKVMNTLEIKEHLDYKGPGQSLYAIDLPEPEISSTKKYFIDPYLLGVIIGDGGISRGTVLITNESEYIISKVKAKLNTNYTLSQSKFDKITHNIVIKDSDTHKKLGLGKRNIDGGAVNEYKKDLIRLGLMYKKSIDKFIPIEYLNGSIEQRYELLRGLMDTDGEVGKNGNISYSTSSKRLAEDIVLLVRSLGGMARTSQKIPMYTYKGVKKKGNISYRIGIRMKNSRDCVTIPKRLDRLKEYNQYSKSLRLRIENIEKIPSEEAQCIAVDNSDKLFIIDDYIVTHNTILSMHTVININKRLGILILPKYIDKWISDVKELTNVQDNELYIVKGGDSLNNLVTLADNDELEAKIIIFSIRTISNYLKEYETAFYDYEFSYECKPDELIDKLGIGVLLNDETHQEFHAVFKACLYLDPCRFIGLSATLDHNDANIRKMYNIMFPGAARISNIVEYKPYVHSTNVTYSINNMKRIKYKRPQGYNHILYEDSIIKNNLLLKSYTEMIEHYFKIGYLDRKQDGDRILIFVASIKMATILTEHFSMKYDDLDVRRYVEDDPYENVMEGEVVISTILSSGVALDLKGLITVIQTISIKSLQAVKQAYGRLRNLEGKEMQYYSLHCKDIPNHSANAKSNKSILLPMSKYWSDEYYDKTLRVY